MITNMNGFTFRFHRGSLEDSLKTVVVLHSFDEMLDHINSDFICPFEKDDIEINFLECDTRIKENVFVVRSKSSGIIGMTNKEVFKGKL